MISRDALKSELIVDLSIELDFESIDIFCFTFGKQIFLAISLVELKRKFDEPVKLKNLIKGYLLCSLLHLKNLNPALRKADFLAIERCFIKILLWDWICLALDSSH